MFKSNITDSIDPKAQWKINILLRVHMFSFSKISHLWHERLPVTIPNSSRFPLLELFAEPHHSFSFIIIYFLLLLNPGVLVSSSTLITRWIQTHLFRSDLFLDQPKDPAGHWVFIYVKFHLYYLFAVIWVFLVTQHQ